MTAERPAGRAELVELLEVERFSPAPRRHPTVAEALPARVRRASEALLERLDVVDDEVSTARRRRELEAGVGSWVLEDRRVV